MATDGQLMIGVGVFPILILGVLILGLYLYSVFWAAADARSRGKSGLLVALLVLFVHPWPLGLVLWLVFRPEPAWRT